MTFSFEPAIVDAVLKHMNEDHPEDNLLIARAFATQAADGATMTGLDGDGGLWQVRSGTATADVRVPWSGAITERSEIRREIVVLYDRACEKLGVTPRPHD
jgi:hypothetical protein